jgi:PAS domain S-box-containing protein/TyrR family helix-turn-helix protein
MSTLSVDEAIAVFGSAPYFSLPVQDEDGIYQGMICVRTLLFAAEELRGAGQISSGLTRLKAQQMSVRQDLIDLSIYNDVVPFVDDAGKLIGFMKAKLIGRKNSRYFRQIAELERKILEASHNGILAIDNVGMVTIYNPAAERILGRKREEVAGRHIAELDPNMGMMDALNQMTPMTGVRTQINGVSILANRTPLIYEGECVGAMSVFLDLSEYDSVCSQLQSSNSTVKELDAIFENSYDGFYIANREGRVTRVNSAWEKICGFPRAEILGKTAHELVGNRWYDKSAAVAALEQKKTVTLLVNILEGPRKGNQVMATGTPMFDENGELAQIVVNVRDMTDLEQLQRQLEATVELNQRYVSELEQIRLQQLKMEDLVAKSPAMQRVVEMAARIATVDSTLLIMGESGVGKEVITNKIHSLSRRKNQPFIKINCGAIPENLLESELFGYAGGAFTGAKKDGKPGMFELASSGTLFLDEIGELPLGLQVKLLRVLQEKTLTRVGGVKPIPVDVRVIAATNKDLPTLVKAGTFRDDLYYRLNVFGIQIPPLRQRREDIPPLLHEMLRKVNQKYSMQKRFSTAAVERLVNYDWPGNVREMENLVERLVVLVNEQYIEPCHLPESMQGKIETIIECSEAVVLNRVVPYKQAVEELEALLLERAFGEHGSTRKVARVLEVNQSTIVRKMKQYQITRYDA